MKTGSLSGNVVPYESLPKINKEHPMCGIDRFRQVAALLIVGIHTYPLASINENLNFMTINVFARIAVPFFLMITGYFLLPQYLSKERSSAKPLINCIKKTSLLYAIATAIYLPISIYAGYYSEGSIITTIVRNIIFDGTYYHLWYLPASIIGVLLIYFLGRKFSIRTVLGITVVLYLFGLLGDSYYGLTTKIPFLNFIYNAGFQVFSYTRNGLFYAPVFLAMGAMIAKMSNRLSVKACLFGVAVSAVTMLVEGLVLHSAGYQRHDSMYIALLPCMFFLFQLLLSQKGRTRPIFRNVTTWIYILHPLFIVAVRGAVKVMGFASFFVENSIIHFLTVCLLSIVSSLLIAKLLQRRKKQRNSSLVLKGQIRHDNYPPAS